MKRMSRIGCTLALLFLSLGGAPAAFAALQAVSPALNAAAGNIPPWYQDASGLAVRPCLIVGPCGLVAEPGVFDPALPVAFPANIPSEFFYSSITTAKAYTVGGNPALAIVALEAAFLDPNGAATTPNALGATGVTFQRLRVRLNPAPAAGDYTIQHPWGQTTFNCPAAGVRCTFTRDIPVGAVPPNFAAALGVGTADSMSTFPIQTAPPPAAGFLGDGATESPINAGLGSVRNSVIITPPGGLPSTNTLFVVIGQKIGMDVTPFPIAQMKGVVAAVPPTTTPITVTNLSGAVLDFGGATAIRIDPASPNAADFSIVAPPAGTPTCLGALISATAPANTCSFNVVFNPAASAIAARAATVKITPAAANTSAPPTSLILAGTAQFPVTVTVGPNGVLQKVLPTGNVAAITEPADAGSTVTYQALPNTVVPDVSNFFTVFEVNDVTIRPAADGTFKVAVDDAPKAIDVTFVRPGDVSVDLTGAGDGQVTISDALETLKIVTGLNTAPTGAQRVAADVGPLVAGKPTADGLVDISDVLTVLWRVISPTNPNW